VQVRDRAAAEALRQAGLEQRVAVRPQRSLRRFNQRGTVSGNGLWPLAHVEEEDWRASLRRSEYDVEG